MPHVGQERALGEISAEHTRHRKTSDTARWRSGGAPHIVHRAAPIGIGCPQTPQLPSPGVGGGRSRDGGRPMRAATAGS